ncbi:MAG: hypothetical protein MRY83_03335, partial [Flavobacteriales bacterium]|nr:hypothetical protein [Flavobacteriales bacterium]
MRFILLFLLLNFYNAQSQLVIDSIPTPFSSVNDIAYSENAIWVVTGGTPFIQKLDTSNGNILKTLTHSVDGPFGLTFDGTNLWVSGNISDSIFQIDTITGNTIASYPTPGAAPEHVLGLAWNKDSSKLYLGDSHVSNPVSPSDTLYVLDTLGNLLNQKKTTQLPGGLTYGANYLWVCDNFYDSI